MKHLLKKKSLQGAGWVSKSRVAEPEPTILKPPNLGNYKVLQSFSVAEVIDLISDGPIKGLVNQHGQLLNSENILQGIYLDGTPVQTSYSISSQRINSLASKNISSILEVLGDEYYVKQQGNQDAYFKNALLKGGSSRDEWFQLIINKYNKDPLKLKRAIYSYYAYWGPNKNPQSLGDKSVSKYGSDPVGSTLGELDFGNVNLNVQYDMPQYLNWGNEGTKGIFTKTIEAENGQTYKFYIDVKLEKIASRSFLKETYDELNLESSKNLSTSQKHFISLVKEKIEILDKKSRIKFSDIRYNEESFCYISLKLGTPSNPFTIDNLTTESIYKKDEDGEYLIDSNGNKIIDDFSFELESFAKQGIVSSYLVPIINENNEFTGKFYGSLLFKMPIIHKRVTSSFVRRIRYSRSSKIVKATGGIGHFVFDENILLFTNSNSNLKFFRGKEEESTSSRAKYNFTNISCEYRYGEENQTALDNFKYIYVDYEYNTKLVGPFNANAGNVERVQPLIDGGGSSSPKTFGTTASSKDIRDGKNYSAWNDINMYSEEATPFTHTIDNPNVNLVYFTLSISELSDTVEKDEGSASDPTRRAGEKRPSIVKIRVEIGQNDEDPISTTRYSIAALVEGAMLIDFGCPELKNKADNYKGVNRININDEIEPESNLAIPFKLPNIDPNADNYSTKRYIKVYKESAETNSVLLTKDLSIYKVTEIIDNKMSYPFSAIFGLKIDGRSFETSPERTYDCRLKKVKIPTNYFPLEGLLQTDKRYVSKASEYTEKKLVYNGDWDGSFREDWTDNPAWIIYDLLTSKRYGLGAYLDETQINKWELYKIGRFCDAVDENGYFEGVSDGVGGLEPRYSCNVCFKNSTKIYDAINDITNLFRGVCYFSNSEINFLDDRPRLPIMTFSNTNIKEGLFNYSNIRKDQQYNTIQVSYLDRFDNFQSKIEYVEDEEDIRKRGVFKTTIETLGVTSRAMARRIGQHMIYQTIKENQSVEFIAGLDALLCRPGDLIIIEDDLKTRSNNFGRILEVDSTNKTLRLENTYLPEEYNGKITVYIPTGYTTNEEFNEIALKYRTRLPFFKVTKNLIDSSDNILTGDYAFYKYVDGYPEDNIDYLPIEFPLYTGKHVNGHDLYCYFNTGVTGFVFATGFAYKDNNLYDKVITNTGVYSINDIISLTGTDVNNQNLYEYNNTGFRYQSSNTNKRSSTSNVIATGIKSKFDYEYNGILDSEIRGSHNSQIMTFNITGYQIAPAIDYGSKVFLDKNDININLTQFIKQGSPYIIGRNNAQDQIYKVLAIKEENQNEYAVVGSKYNTGKFVEIEKFKPEDFLPSTYYAGPSKVGNIVIDQLQAPKITNFTTGIANVLGFSLNASWQPVNKASYYKYNVYNKTFNENYTGETTTTGILIENISTLGEWKLEVSSANNNNDIDSQNSSSGLFVAYYNPGVALYTKPSIINFTIS